MAPSFSLISIAELAERLAQNPRLILLDVRTPEEYSAGHIPQARNEELDRLRPADLLASGVVAADQPLYLVCRTSNRARKAAEKFMVAGHGQVVVVEGGTLGWIEARGPIASGG